MTMDKAAEEDEEVEDVATDIKVAALEIAAKEEEKRHYEEVLVP